MKHFREAPALSFEHDFSKDAEGLRILITVTIWAIWKSRNKSAITNQDVAPSETREILKELISDIKRKSWNATRFMEGVRRSDRQRELRALWADKRPVDFDLKQVRTLTSLNGMWPSSPAWEGFSE